MTRKQQALELFAGLPRHCDLIPALFSFGQDPRWRRTIVSRDWYQLGRFLGPGSVAPEW